MLVNSFSGVAAADWVFFSTTSTCCLTSAAEAGILACLKLLLSICDLFSVLLLDRDTEAPFDLTSMGITRDLVFLTSSGIMRTPGFGEGGLAVTVVVVVVVDPVSSCFLAVCGSTADLCCCQLLLIGTLGAGTGGSGGLLAAAACFSFSGEGVLDFELTTSSLMTFVLACFDRVGLISSQEELDEVEPRRLSSLLVLLLLLLSFVVS